MIIGYVIVLLSTPAMVLSAGGCTGSQGNQVNFIDFGCLNATVFDCFRTSDPNGLCTRNSTHLALERIEILNESAIEQYWDDKFLLRPRTGPRCEKDSTGRKCCFSPCKSSNPCFNSGQCFDGDDFGNESFTCKCNNQDSYGSWCEINSKCKGCDSNANCNGTTGVCECKKGYDGSGFSCRAICPAIELLSKCGIVTFNKTLGTYEQYSNEMSDGRHLAGITCPTNGGAYDNTTLHCVPYNKTINDMPPVTNTTTTEQIEEILADLPIITSKEEKSPDEVENTTSYLKQLANSLENKTQISQKSMRDVMEIAENLNQDLVGEVNESRKGTDVELTSSETPETAKKRNSTRDGIPEIIDKFARKVNLTGNKTLEITTRTMTVGIVDPEEKDGSILEEVIFDPDANVIVGADSVKKKTLRMSIPVATLKEMKTLLNDGTEEKMRIVFVLYQDATLLTVDQRTGQVVQATFKEGETKTANTNLNENKFIIEYRDPPKSKPEHKEVIESTNYKLKLDYFCVFMDFRTQDWATQGCTYHPNEGGIPYCECNHFTSFALLLRVTKVLKNYAPNIYSLVACGLSVLGLVATILIYLLVRELRARRPTPIMINICANLAAGYVLFIVGMDGKQKGFSDVGCYVSAVLMHVAFLCSWFWMLIYSLNMYYALVKVVGTTPLVSKKLFMYLVGYGLPVIIVGTDLIVSHELDKTKKGYNEVNYESHYISTHVCWVRHMSMYLGFATPVGVILFINIVLFFMIIRKLTWKRTQIQSSREATTVKQQIYMAVTILSMMGLTWAFGYIMLISPDPTFQDTMTIIFDVFNTGQGVVIFLMSCVRQKAVREMWLLPIVNCCHTGRRGNLKGAMNFTNESGTTTDTAMSTGKRMTDSTAL